MKFLKEFAAECNKKHRRFCFAVFGSKNRATSIEIRYAPEKYRNFLSHESWEQLKKGVKTRSRSTLFVATDEDLFMNGIVEIKIASCSYRYRESDTAVGTIKWIEDFFPPIRN